VAVVGDEEKGSGRWPRFSGPQGIAHNGWRYVFVADFGARHCQTTMKFEASHNR
jgi:hypothetical protein